MKKIIIAILLALPFAVMAQTPIYQPFDYRFPFPPDSREMAIVGGKAVPYATVGAANAATISGYRYIGQVRKIGADSAHFQEYWYYGGISDGNLVVKSVAGGYPTFAAPSAFNVSGSGTSAITLSATGSATTQFINGAGGLGLVSNLPISTATQSALDAKQGTLISGTNLRTVNGNSLLGNTDLVISGGGGSIDTTSLSNRINTKQPNLSAGANISIAGNVISATGSSSYADSAKVSSMSLLDGNYKVYDGTPNKAGYSGSGIPTGDYYALASPIGNTKDFESLSIAAKNTGTIVISFFNKVAGNVHTIYSETTSVASTGYITIPYSSLSIPDRTFAGMGDVYVGVRVMTANIFDYKSESGSYISYSADAAPFTISAGLTLGLQVNYSQKPPLITQVLANSASSPIKTVAAVLDAITQAGVNGGGNIFLDTGIFNFPTYISLPSNTRFKGSGAKTIIKSADATYVFYIANADNVEVSNLTIDGSDSSSARARINARHNVVLDSNAGTKSGLYLYRGVNPYVHDLVVKNCNLYGICTNGTGGGSSPLTNSTVINNVYLHNNYKGIQCQSEYSILMAIRADSNACGLYISSGNVKTSASYFTINQVNIALKGGGNDSHGDFTGIGSNHAGIAGFYATNTTLPETINGCEFYQGAIFLDTCLGISITSSQISSTITVTNGAGNRSALNIFISAYGAGAPTLLDGGTLDMKLNTWSDGTSATAINN